MATNALSGAAQYKWLSSYDFYKLQDLNKLYSQHGDQFMPLFQLFRSMGKEVPVANEVFNWFEDNYIHDIIHSKNTVGAPGAGNAQSITLDSTDLVVSGTSYRYYPRLNDIITFHNEKQGIITAIDVSVPSAPVLTVYPLRNTDDLGALTAGDELIITSNAFQEGTDQPTGAYRGSTKRTGYCQIFKEAFEITGSELARQRRYEFYDEVAGEWMAYREGQYDVDYRLALKIDGAFLMGTSTTSTNYNTSIPAASNGETLESRTTDGIIPTIRDRGYVYSYAPGTFGITDFDFIARRMVRERATSPYVLCISGILINQEIENAAAAFTKDTAVDFTKVTNNIFGGNEALALSIGFKSIQKSGKTFLLSQNDNFSNPKLYGAAGYDHEKMGIFIPVDKVKDPKSGDMIDSFSIRYMSYGNYSRKYEVWEMKGAGGGTYNSTIDKAAFEVRAHVGLQITAANRLILVDPV